MEICVNMNKEKTGSILPIMAMDSISDAGPDALKITGLVKSGGTVTGYQLSDGRIVSRKSGVELAKDIVKAYLEAEFEGGRHATRVDMIMDVEKRNHNL